MKQVTVKKAGINIKKQITAVLIVGMVLMLVDFIVATQDMVRVEQSYGQLYLIRPEAGEGSSTTSLTAEIKGKGQNREKKINVVLEPYSNQRQQDEEQNSESMEMTEDERLEYQLRAVVDDFNDDLSVRKVELPATLETGEKINWQVEERPGTNTMAIFAVTMISAFALYKNRHASVRKWQQQCRDSVLQQLPEFVNRLVLLLNAGMVLNSAFMKAVEEGLQFNKADGDYFNKKLKEIYLSVKTANGAMHQELRSFAKESGSKELMRVSNIINDNINKGVELTQKLQNEAAILWMSRKKYCEEKGRLAETKLTLPLVIFLMVLIVITVAPALLEL